MKRKRSATWILLFLAFAGLFVLELVSILNFTSLPNYYLSSRVGMGFLFFFLSLATLVLMALACWFLWRPRPVGFWIALAALALPVLSASIVLMITLLAPDVAREAHLSFLAAQGRPRPSQEELDVAFSAAGVLRTFVKQIDLYLIMAVVLSWKRDLFLGPWETAQYKQVIRREIVEKVKNKHQKSIDELQAMGFKELCVSSETVSAWGSPLGLMGLLAFFMVWFKEVARVTGFFRIVSFYPILVHRESAAYAYVFGLGVKFFTGFADGTVLGTTNYASSNISDNRDRFYKFSEDRTIEAAWAFHRGKVDEFEAGGKQARDRLHFEDYVQIARREDEYQLVHRSWAMRPATTEGNRDA